MLRLDTSSLIAYLQAGYSSRDGGLLGASGLLRATILRTGRRAKLADSLIAQSCLDHQATLITRDRDFSVFASLAGLRLAIASP